MSEHVDFVFEPAKNGHPMEMKFVEVEIDGRSIRLGTWIDRPDGLVALRISRTDLEKLES